MHKRIIPVKGIWYNDFKGRWDEVQASVGRRVTLSIEHDNAFEPDAVMVLLGGEHLGYVRSGHDHDEVLAAMLAAERSVMMGRVAQIDLDNRVVWVEVTMKKEPLDHCHACDRMLSSWSYDGPLLSEPREVAQLHALTESLDMIFSAAEPWDEDIDNFLTSLERHCWRDVSCEHRTRMEHILLLLTNHPEIEGYAQAAARVQGALDRMGTTATRQRLVQGLMQMAMSGEMTGLLHDNDAQALVEQLPSALINLFWTDAEALMGRLWYLRCPYNMLRAVWTLLAVEVRVRHDADARAQSQKAEKTTEHTGTFDWLMRKMIRSELSRLPISHTTNYNAPVGQAIGNVEHLDSPNKEE